MKKIIIFGILVLVLFISGCFINACNKTCKEKGYFEGECIRTGSGVGTTHCVNLGAESIGTKNIWGCRSGWIGSWHECCCFKSDKKSIKENLSKFEKCSSLQLTTAKKMCEERYCNEARYLDSEQWSNSDYCTKTFEFEYCGEKFTCQELFKCENVIC